MVYNNLTVKISLHPPTVPVSILQDTVCLSKNDGALAPSYLFLYHHHQMALAYCIIISVSLSAGDAYATYNDHRKVRSAMKMAAGHSALLKTTYVFLLATPV